MLSTHPVDMHNDSVADRYESRLLFVLASIILISIIISTYIHFFKPEIFNVPEGSNSKDFLSHLLFLEILSFLMAFLCLINCHKNFGAFLTILFFSGAFLFSGVVENLIILTSRFNLLPFQTYYFNKGGLTRFIEVPTCVCLCWSLLAYSSFYITQIIIPKAGPMKKAIVAALICMDIDLWMDPVMTHPTNQFWTWLNNNNETFQIFSIPVYNFIGWFGIIFSFNIIWLHTKDHLKELGRKKTMKRFFISIFIASIACFLIFIGVEFLIRSFIHPTNISFKGI